MVPAPTTSIFADRPLGAADYPLLAMVHWQDPEVIVYVFFIYEQIAVFLLGFYGCAPFFPLRYVELTGFLSQDPVLMEHVHRVGAHHQEAGVPGRAHPMAARALCYALRSALLVRLFPPTRGLHAR